MIRALDMIRVCYSKGLPFQESTIPTYPSWP